MRISNAIILASAGVFGGLGGSLAHAAPIAHFQQIGNSAGGGTDNSATTNTNNYTSVPRISSTDFLQGATATANANGAKLTSSLTPAANSGAIGVLTDGVSPGPDDPARVYFGAGSGYTLVIDLGSVQPVYQINSYSRHTGNRTPQTLSLDGSNDPTFATFTNLVPSATYGVNTGQVGVSFHDDSQATADGSPGTTPLSNAFRYYRINAANSVQFLGEIDVVVPEPASLGLLGAGALGLLARRRRTA